MEVRCWKKIVLQWVTECSFMDRNYYNLEQTDIDGFYRNFRHNHKVLRAGNKSNNLTTFLHEYYIDFEPNWDDENSLSSTDYIYVYTLFLHFSCVKSPEPYFHEICQKLTEQSQQCIALFFNQLLDCTTINRENLRHAIGNVSKNASPNTSNGEHFTCSAHSPINPSKTQSSSTSRISPSTPKTFLLEERTRELYNLRAQLETERYEKGLLEVQIKQNEEKILQLNQDHKKLQQQIQDLKTDILQKNTESSSPNREGDDQMKRRLCKDISLKEQEIFKLNDLMCTLKEEKHLVQEKLEYAEKQVVICMDRVKELDYKVDEMATELEHKSSTIKYLSDAKFELEQFIAETRSSSMNSRPDFNSSVDCLDSSFTRGTNSSGSVNSPENLGCSVIDVQLREKEVENVHLREELSSIRANNTKLARQLQKIIQKQSQDFNLNVDGATIAEDEYADPAEYFTNLAMCINKLSKHYKDDKVKLKTLQEEMQNKQRVSEELTKRVLEFEKEVTILKEGIKNVGFINSELEQNKKRLQERIKCCEQEIETINKQKYEVVTQLESIANDCNSHKEKHEKHCREAEEKIQKLQQELDKRDKAVMSASKTNLDLIGDNTALQNKVTALQQSLLTNAEEMKKLKEEVKVLAHEAEAHKKAELVVKEKHEKLIIQYEAMKKDKRETGEHLEVMRNELAMTELEMGKLGGEILDVRQKNAELEDRIDKLVTEYKNEKQNSDMALNRKEERIREMNTERARLQVELEYARSKLDSVLHEFSHSQEELKVINSKVVAVNIMLHGATRGSHERSDDERDFSANLNEIMKNVKELVEYKMEAANKIDMLEFDNVENVSKMHYIEEQLQTAVKQKKELAAKHDHQVEAMHIKMDEFDRKIQEYEEQVHKLAEEHAGYIEDTEQQLQMKDDEFSEMQRATEEKEQLMKAKYEMELKQAQEFNASKERELMVVIAEHNDVKKKLQETQTCTEELQKTQMQLQSNYAEKLQNFEMKIDCFNAENNKLVNEIEEFKKEHAKAELRLIEADEASNQLSGQLNLENASRTELNVKLEASEVRLMETELKLESILNEKSHTINSLKTTYESQAEILTRVQEQVSMLQRLKSEQTAAITTLKNNMCKMGEEKARLLKDISSYTEQIEEEKAEKLVLLQSHEKLNLQVKEKGKQIAELQDHCTEFEKLLHAANEEHEKLHREFQDKQNKLFVTLKQHEYEHNDLLTKISELTRKLAEQSVELESNDMAILDIVAILDNNVNFASEAENVEIKSVFNVEENEIDTNYGKLKMTLNRLMYTIAQLHQQMDNIEHKRQGAIEVLTKANDKLSNQIMRNKAEIAELQDLLAGETKSMENKLNNEVKRLNEDIQNLEEVNEKLSDENCTMQCKLTKFEEENANVRFSIELVSEEKNKLSEKLVENAELLAKLRLKEIELNESLKQKQMSAEQFEEKCLQLDQQVKEQSTALQKADEELKTANENVHKMQAEFEQLQLKHTAADSELKELTEKYRVQQLANDTMEHELAQRITEFAALQTKITELQRTCKHFEGQYKTTSERLDESIRLRLSSENKYELLNSQFQQLKRDHDFSKVQHKSSVADMKRLQSDVETLKQDKLQLASEVKDGKRELQRANDNVTQLIQQIASIRLEKESVVEECQFLRKQIKQNEKYHTTSETKLRNIVERSQSLESKLLSAENDLKSISLHLEKSEGNADKLSAENQKLRDTQDANTKRIEKLALKLGDSQARCAKLERDNEKLSKTVESDNVTVQALQREKDALQSDIKSLKERLAKAERAQEPLNVKVQMLEQANVALEEAKEKLEASEIDNKSKLSKLEKMRESNEEKIRKLNHAISTSEHANVRLNLEIGAINSQLGEAKNAAIAERAAQLDEITKNVIEAKEQAQKYEELAEKLETETNQLREENSNVRDQLSKTSLSLDITKEKCSALTRDIEQLRINISAMREQKLQVEQEHVTTCAKLKQYEELNEKLIENEREQVIELESKVMRLECELSAKAAKVTALQQEIEKIRSNVPDKSVIETTASIMAEMENMRTRLIVAETVLDTEQKTTAQLRLDNQILQAKYREAKQRALEECKASEERIKENRLELEGKLEKMKNKMKTLYTEEITKMKSKQDRETLNLKSDMDVLKAQNVKYEEHTRKLSSQIVRLNEKILEHQKQNAVISTKLKHIQDYELSSSSLFKRPCSLHVSTVSSTSSAPHTNTNTGPSSLAMEDEDGEIFNNTYLTDLKCGRMSTDIGPDELRYRNSLLPPHLKSTYAAQYDHGGLPEDNLKDGPHSLDDSMCTLLSTTVGGTRKKLTGITHYKRPGPPTPSKNGGRLSLGGTSEPAREILRETYDSTNAVSSSKTPARFGFFASRFSLGNNNNNNNMNSNRDEFQFFDLRRVIHRRNFQFIHLSNVDGTGIGAICTSTPRKSQTHFEQRRLLDQMLKHSPSPSPLAVEPSPSTAAAEAEAKPADASYFETPVTALQRPIPAHMKILEQQQALRRRRSSLLRRHLSRRLYDIRPDPTYSNNTSTTSSATTTDDWEEINAPQIEYTTAATSPSGSHNILALQKRLQRRPKRERGTRPSLNLRGNLCTKYRIPNRVIIRDLNRKKAHKQRIDNFNKQRMRKSMKLSTVPRDEFFLDGVEMDVTHVLENNNYTSNNHGMSHHRKRLSETVVIAKVSDHVQDGETIKDMVAKLVDNMDNDEFREVSEDDYEFDDLEMEDGTDGITLASSYDDYVDVKNVKQELVTTQDLIEFDKRNDLLAAVATGANTAENPKIEVDLIEKKEENIEDEAESEEVERDENNEDEAGVEEAENKFNAAPNSQNFAQHFEHLLKETESSAPFKVRHIKFDQNTLSSSNSSPTTIVTFSTTTNANDQPQPQQQPQQQLSIHSSTDSTNASSSHSDAGMRSSSSLALAPCSTIISTNDHQLTSHSTSASPHLSRIIYGGSIVYSRRLPNIDTTYVRKSSIYIKNNNNATCSSLLDADNDAAAHDDIILVTNQTITLMDLARMWKQMNNSTRLIICFAFLASMTTIFGLFVTIFRKDWNWKDRNHP